MKNMKYIKKFESKDQVELLRNLLMENPSYKTHDFYIFIGRDDFKEAENGMYKKSIDIEKMVKITPDEASLGAMNGMELRVRFNPEASLYHIWLPKEISEEVEGKGSNSIEDWLVDLINKHKMKGADQQGKNVYKDVKQRKDDMKKYNM